MTIARYVFVSVGMFWLLIGVLSALLVGKGVGPPMIFISERTDSALYGGHPDAVLASDPALATLRNVTVRVLSGMLVALGMLTAGMAWFGLRDGDRWTLIALTVIGIATIPYWWGSLAPYREAGVTVRLGDVPPFMWVPTLLLPAASIVAWVDYLRV